MDPSGGSVSLRSKILAIMALPVMVLLIATFALLRARQQNSEALMAERDAVSVHDTLERVLADLTGAETGMGGYLLTGETSFLEPYTEGTQALIRDLHTLTGLMSDDPGTTAEMATLRGLVNQRLSLLQTIQLLAPVTDLTNHGQLIRELNRGKDAMDEIRDLVGRQESEAADLLTEKERDLDAKRHVFFLVGFVGLPLGVFASLLVVMLFVQRLAGRIVRTEEIARMLDEGMPLREPSTSDDELGRLERVLVQSGTRLRELQGELRRMGTSDALTRLINRRGFLPTAEHQLKVAERTHQPIALMFLDLDGLKKVNDTLGHSAGDRLITEGAFVLRETFRASDLIARMGGDEFCVLFAAESYHAAKIALTRLKNAVDEANAQEGRPFILSFSAGVATFDPEDPCTLDQLIARADAQMYVRKHAKSRKAEAEAAVP
ncbi:MAG: diguanylate cyclase domain-containing protein [Actinomycetota bacterium]